MPQTKQGPRQRLDHAARLANMRPRPAPGARHGPANEPGAYPGGESHGPARARTQTGVRLGPVPAPARAAGVTVRQRQGPARRAEAAPRVGGRGQADADVSVGNFEKRGKGRALGYRDCAS